MTVTLSQSLRAQTGFALLLVLEGVAAGALWRLLIPFFLDHSDHQEANFAVEGGLALIGAAAGLLVAMAVVIRPGRQPSVRTAVAIAGSFVGSVLMWLTGEAFGAPELQSIGILLMWPVVTATLVFLSAMLPVTGDRLNEGS